MKILGYGTPYIDDTRMDPPKQEMSLLGYVVNPDSIGTGMT